MEDNFYIRLYLIKAMLCFWIAVLFFSSARAQQPLTLQIKITDNDSIQTLLQKNDKSLFSYKNKLSSTLERTREIQKFLFTLNENGYIAASLDSTRNDSLNMVAFIHSGAVYKWTHLRKGNVDEDILSLTGYREKLFNNKIFSLAEVRKLQEKILTFCEDNGYPFATVKLDSITIKDNLFQASINLNKHMRVKIDSIIIKGNAKITPVYLYSYLSIKPGDLYKESLIAQIATRLRELPFVKETRPSTVLFTDTDSKMYLYLEDKKANQFDGIIGFLPRTNNTSQIVVTGEARLKLISPFGRGEQIDLNWRKIDINTQDLKTRFIYPFIFSSPFGVELNLALYKKDTFFVDLLRSVAVQYLLQGGNYLKIFANNKESTLLSTYGLEKVAELPPYADVSSTIYGLGLKKEKLDYRLNPRKGYSIEINGGAGNKHIKKNDKVPAYLYQNIKLDVTQYNIDYSLEAYFPLSGRMVLNAGVKGANIISPTIFQNELFRFGGLKTLRGFDEESIFASSYTVLKLEYRYIIETNAYLFGFFNGAGYQNNSINKKIKDTPYGYGAGITFETKLGIFSVTYALGKQFDNPIYFRAGKIHFGIVNYF